MDADSNRGEQAPAESGSGSESSSLPARRFTSAGNRLQAMLAAADTAAEDILEGARAEARELIQRAEQVATDRTAQLQTQVEILLTQANDLTQRAQQLSEATRELTSSVNRVVSVEAPAVTELELGSGEVEHLTARPLPPASIGAGPSPAEAQEPSAPAEEAVVEPEPDEAEEATPEAEPPSAEIVEAQTEAEEAPPTADEARPAAEAAPAQPQQQSEPPAPSGPRPSQPPPKPEQAAPPAAEEEATESEEAEEAEKEPRRRRSLFSRLRRGGHAEETVEVQRFANRPRASEDAISDVSPGHQMLARQMLLDGLSEEEIERRLRDEFRVRDPGAVLDSLQLNGPLIPPAKDEANE